ncbi:hypothetical protein TNCV_2357201 [Trichonephila clavipes]|nr:hypothetical protein TNCV_2357201 [Trichonephila clavipes]
MVRNFWPASGIKSSFRFQGLLKNRRVDELMPIESIEVQIFPVCLERKFENDSVVVQVSSWPVDRWFKRAINNSPVLLQSITLIKNHLMRLENVYLLLY